MLGKPKTLAGIAAAFWILAGIRLLLMGYTSFHQLHAVYKILIVLLVAGSVGLLKGVFLFGKMAKQNLNRLKEHPLPIPLYRLFPTRTYLFILFFMPLGITLGKFLHDPFARSLILLSVGAALSCGGAFYLINWRKTFAEQTS